MEDSSKTLKYLEEVEKLALSILEDKNEIIELNKKQNDNREALRALQKTPNKKHYLSIGSMYLKTQKPTCIEMLQTDQIKIESEINILRSNLKVKVNQLRDLEFQPPIDGFWLNALNQKEIQTIKKALGVNSP